MKTLHINYATKAFTRDVVDATPTKRASRSLKLLQENALIKASEDRCRALLAQTAINDVASIAMVIDRLSCIAPEGRPYYQRILKAYAETAAHKIERW